MPEANEIVNRLRNAATFLVAEAFALSKYGNAVTQERVGISKTGFRHFIRAFPNTPKTD